MVLDRIADKWTILIVGSLMYETKRFGVLRREIEGVSQKMLTQTLRGMERDGLINRKIYPTIPPKVEYSLTDSGQSLIKILLDIQDWTKDNTNNILASRKAYDASLDEQ
ncbi:winged helix-turn-helix transcriptional regulator [Psychromonas marina]|nr:helix-turn-helix domain-containing protein [Psychromonas marina]